MINDITLLLVKILLISLLLVYFIFFLLNYRQTQLMNRAVKTLVSGCINFLSLLNIIFILIIIILILLV